MVVKLLLLTSDLFCSIRRKDEVPLFGASCRVWNEEQTNLPRVRLNAQYSACLHTLPLTNVQPLWRSSRFSSLALHLTPICSPSIHLRLYDRHQK